MPSINDVFNELVQMNTNLNQVNNKLTQLHTDNVSLINGINTVNSSVSIVNNTLNNGFSNLATGLQAMIILQNFTNQALVHNDKQNDTIICELQKISQNTCRILNESHLQTGLQTSINANIEEVTEMYGHANSEAALAFNKLAELKNKIGKCCPPEPPKPVCINEPCKLESKLGEGPKVDYNPYKPREEQGPK